MTSESGSITLTWDAPMYDGGSKIIGYIIYHKVSGSSSWSKTDVIPFD